MSFTPIRRGEDRQISVLMLDNGTPLNVGLFATPNINLNSKVELYNSNNYAIASLIATLNLTQPLDSLRFSDDPQVSTFWGISPNVNALVVDVRESTTINFPIGYIWGKFTLKFNDPVYNPDGRDKILFLPVLQVIG
jgi:hypothetical protein